MQDKLQLEDTVSADRKERIVFDPDAWRKSDKSGKKISAITSRQNFDNEKFTRKADKDENVEESVIQPTGTSQIDVGATECAADGVKDSKKKSTGQIQFVTGNQQVTSSTAIGNAQNMGIKKISEALVKKAIKQIKVDKNVGTEEIPFDGPYTKSSADVVDKSGAHHSPSSRARHLARQAMMKQSMKEELKGNQHKLDKTVKEEVESDYLLEYPEDLQKMKKADSYKVGDKIWTKVGSKWHPGHITTPLNKAGNHGVKFQHGGKTHSYVSSPDQLRLHVEEVELELEESIKTVYHKFMSKRAGKKADHAYDMGNEKEFQKHVDDAEYHRVKAGGRPTRINTNPDAKMLTTRAPKNEEVELEEGVTGAVAGGYLGHKTQQGANASKAVKKKIVKEEETTVSKTYAEFIEQLNEYNAKDGVYRHKGTYGGSYDSNDDHDDDEPKKPAAPAVKRGRGRPAGSKSGANQKVTTGKSYGGIATHSLNLPNSNR